MRPCQAKWRGGGAGSIRPEGQPRCRAAPAVLWERVMREPPSPCNRVCRIDQATGWCLGCRRTLTEIADWPMLSPAEKQALLRQLERRC